MFAFHHMLLCMPLLLIILLLAAHAAADADAARASQNQTLGKQEATGTVQKLGS
jgi:hypothetical protein